MGNANDRRRATCDLVLAVSLLVVVTGAALLGTGCDSATDDMIKPTPADRFLDNGDGTVTDTNTGLVWLKNANCFGLPPLFDNWNDAMALVAGLSDGQCGLTDGSSAGDWRLPTLQCPQVPPTTCRLDDATGEFASIFTSRCPRPSILDTAGTGCWSEGDPFSRVRSDFSYWSSTTHSTSGRAFNVWLGTGTVSTNYTIRDLLLVWPVRDRL